MFLRFSLLIPDLFPSLLISGERDGLTNSRIKPLLCLDPNSGVTTRGGDDGTRLINEREGHRLGRLDVFHRF